jgi:hypothetical protein
MLNVPSFPHRVSRLVFEAGQACAAEDPAIRLSGR